MNARLLRCPEGEQARCISVKLYREEAQCFKNLFTLQVHLSQLTCFIPVLALFLFTIFSSCYAMWISGNSGFYCGMWPVFPAHCERGHRGSDVGSWYAPSTSLESESKGGVRTGHTCTASVLCQYTSMRAQVNTTQLAQFLFAGCVFCSKCIHWI